MSTDTITNINTNEKKEEREKLKSLNIYQKLSLVSRECQSIEKDGKVEGSRGFKYATAANIMSVVNPALFKYRLVAYVNFELVESQLIQVTNKDGREQTNSFVTVRAVGTVVNVDNPAEQITLSAIGQGKDPGDTAASKAQTFATKNMFINSFQMEQQEDPEKDYNQHQDTMNQKYLDKKPQTVKIQTRSDAIQNNFKS